MFVRNLRRIFNGRIDGSVVNAMANVLLTGGRAPVCLELARQFQKEGHRVVIAESQQPHLCQASHAVSSCGLLPAPRFAGSDFSRGLNELIDEHKIDVLIPTCEEAFFVAQSRELIRPHAHVLVDSFAKLNRLHNKWTFVLWASELNLPVPESYEIASMGELESLSRGLKGDWILKPSYSRFGAQVHRAHAKQLTSVLPNIDQSWIVQRFVEGEEICISALAKDGDLLALSLYSHPFVAGKAGVCFEEISRPKLEAAIADFIKKTEFTGQIAFDVIEEADGEFFVLECNPRATSGVHLMAAASNLPEAYLRAANRTVNLDQCLRAPPGTTRMVALGVLFYGIKQIKSWQNLKTWLWYLLCSRDVIFSWRDPGPAIYQFYCYFVLWWQSRKARISVESFSTFDIEWNGPWIGEKP